MINAIKPGLLPLLVLLGGSASEQQKKDCHYKGIPLYGKVKIVEHLPDLTVQVVQSFPDLKVKLVDQFPDECGEWQIVEHLPDIKVKFVTAFPDVKIQYVNAFPGRTNTKLD